VAGSGGLPGVRNGELWWRAWHRRKMIAAVLATGLVGLALVAGHHLRSTPGMPLVRPTPAGMGVEYWMEHQQARLPVAGTFVDVHSGYLLVRECHGYKVGEICVLDLAVTADGGRSWTRHSLPALDSSQRWRTRQDLHVLGPQTLAVDQLCEGDGAQPALCRWFSIDGAATWRSQPVGDVAEVPAVPAGATLFYPVISDTDPWVRSSAAGEQVQAIRLRALQADGSSVLLPGAPAFTLPGDVVAVGDTIFVSGVGPADLSWGVFASHDRGRTWTAVPTPGDNNTGVRVYTMDGRTVYLVGPTREGGTWMRRSTDGGTTWSTPDLPPAAANPPQTRFSGLELPMRGQSWTEVAAAPTTDGSLLLVAGQELYRLAPDATSFLPVEHAPRVIVSVAAAGAVVIGLVDQGPPAPIWFTFTASERQHVAAF
jgi:hypothetical protein